MSAKLSTREQVFTALYAGHQRWLQGWLAKKTGCPHRAADLVQEAFLRVFHLAEPENLREPRAFLTTTATRLIIDQERRRKIERAFLEEMARLVETSPRAYASPEELLQATQTLHAVVTMLAGLAEKPRRAFLLRHLDGLMHAEIAEELKVSVSMVKQYLAQAMTHSYIALHGEGA